MNIDVEDRAGIRLLRLQGELGTDKVLSEAVVDFLGERGVRLVLDMGQVTYMNSTGIGELVRITAQANVQGGRLVLANPSTFVQGLLEATKLNKFFEVHPTVDDAVKALT